MHGFIRGSFFSFASVDPKLKSEFSALAESYFKNAGESFNVLLEKYPNDPFLLLYKGMNLTFLNRGQESVANLKMTLSIDPNIFEKKNYLGIIACWKHIDPNFLKEWQVAMNDYKTE